MASHNVGCIIISNSDDLHFLQVILRESHATFKDIVISVGTRLWNERDPEDISKFDAFEKDIVSQYTNVKLIRYDVPGDKVDCMAAMVKPSMYWEAHARWIALEQLDKKCEYVMFLDSDEIIDDASFRAWLDSEEYKKHDAMKLANYWYWREPIYRAKDYIEDSVVFMKRSAIYPLFIFSNMGRQGVFDACKATNEKPRCVAGIDGKPMIHHFSWVRDKDAMIRKVTNWGHRDDTQLWVSLVHKEFSGPFSGTDFIRGRQYDIVENIFNIKMN